MCEEDDRQLPDLLRELGRSGLSSMRVRVRLEPDREDMHRGAREAPSAELHALPLGLLMSGMQGQVLPEPVPEMQPGDHRGGQVPSLPGCRHLPRLRGGVFLQPLQPEM